MSRMEQGLLEPAQQSEQAERATDPGLVRTDGGRTLAGGATNIPRSSQDVLDVEGTVVQERAAAQRSTTLAAWLFRADSEPRQVGLQELSRLVAADENFVWLDLAEYRQPELHEVARLLQLPVAAVRLAEGAWQRPRLEVFRDQFWMTATVAYRDAAADRVSAGQLDLFVGRNFLVSVHKRPLPFAARALARAEHAPQLVQLDSVYMLYILLDELLAYYEEMYEEVDDEIEQMEERALTDASDEFLAGLLHFKRYIFTAARLVEQHRTVFAAFRRPDFRFVSGEGVEGYYRDLDERLSALIGLLAGGKDAVNGTFNIYVSRVSHGTNHVMKLLTMVSTTLLPTTVILGFFSTNFEQIPLYSPATFWVMVACMLAVSSAILWLFHRRGWL